VCSDGRERIRRQQAVATGGRGRRLPRWDPLTGSGFAHSLRTNHRSSVATVGLGSCPRTSARAAVSRFAHLAASGHWMPLRWDPRRETAPGGAMPMLGSSPLKGLRGRADQQRAACTTRRSHPTPPRSAGRKARRSEHTGTDPHGCRSRGPTAPSCSGITLLPPSGGLPPFSIPRSVFAISPRPSSSRLAHHNQRVPPVGDPVRSGRTGQGRVNPFREATLPEPEPAGEGRRDKPSQAHECERVGRQRLLRETRTFPRRDYLWEGLCILANPPSRIQPEGTPRNMGIICAERPMPGAGGRPGMRPTQGRWLRSNRSIATPTANDSDRCVGDRAAGDAGGSGSWWRIPAFPQHFRIGRARCGQNNAVEWDAGEREMATSVGER
jgi:hypothetical protein